MDRERFLSDLERQRQFCEGKSPLYSSVYGALGRALSEGQPAWFERLLKAWKGRAFTTWYEAPNVLLASVHYHSLQGELSLTGPDPAAAVLDYLDGAPPSFWAGVATARLQTNEAGRAPGWMLPASAAFLSQRLPFHLVDMGTSAGLTLIGDYLERFWELTDESGERVKAPAVFDQIPYPVLSRTGLDLRPLRLQDEKDRLWLKALIWADDKERQARFENAAGLFVRLAKETGGPRVATCGFTEMGDWILANLKPHPEEGLLLYNSQATDFLSDADYEKFRAGIVRALEPWGERGLWVEFEMPRGQKEAFHELTAHRLKDGRLATHVLATLTAHPREVRLRGGWDFLLPAKPVRPRFTIEEPEKQMAPGLYKFPTS